MDEAIVVQISVTIHSVKVLYDVEQTACVTTNRIFDAPESAEDVDCVDDESND